MNAINTLMAWLLERSIRGLFDIALLAFEVWTHREEFKQVAVSAADTFAAALGAYRTIGAR